MSRTHDSDDGSDDSNGEASQSRRTLLKAAAAVGLVGGIGEGVLAQDDETEVAETFELQGEIGGWVGVSPDYIEGEQNPTLVMEPGEDYEVIWENVDGASHNFAIEDESNNVFVETDYASSIGATESVTFTAEEGFDNYVCHPHRKTMRGQVVSDESELEREDEDEEMEEEETPAEQEEEQPTEEPSTVFKLALEDGQWRGMSPEEIRGETNPTLSVEPGETYAIAWTLRTQRGEHKTGHNLVIHDEDGRHLTYTKFVSRIGQGRTLVFTADEEMAYYSDQTQLGATGEIEVSGATEDVSPAEDVGPGEDVDPSEEIDPDDIDVEVEVGDPETTTPDDENGG